MVEYVKISNLKEGDVLARTLYDAEMRVMLKNGNKLSANGIRVIKEQGYRGIYIQHEDNGFRQDVPLAEPLVDEMTQLQMVSLIKEIFHQAYSSWSSPKVYDSPSVISVSSKIREKPPLS